MDKKLAKEQEKFRDYVTNDMLAAADKYDNVTTQVLIDCQAKPKPNPYCEKAFRFWLAIDMVKVPQPESSLTWMERQSSAPLAKVATSCATTILCHALLPCCNPHQAGGYCL
jgi:hypothetical protein